MIKVARFHRLCKTLVRGYQVVFLTILVSIIVPSAWAAAVEPIRLMYHDRAPFYVTQEDGSVTGLVAGPAARAFNKSGINFKWELIAANRHLEILKANRTKVCAVGWFKNSEREKFSKYTTYIYQDKPMFAITRTESNMEQRYQKVIDLLAAKNLKMGKKLGYSYGGFIDDLANQYNTQTITSTQSNTGLIRMLIGKRFDYTFFPGDEITSILDEFDQTAEQLTVISFLDMPEGNKRYILCSHMVDDEIIHQLNVNIKAIRP